MSEKWLTKHKTLQLLIGLAAGIGTVPQGIATTFPSSAFPQMALPDSDLKPTKDEAALIAGTLMYGMASCLVAGPLMDFIGRRRTLITIAIPLISGFTLVAAATTPTMIIVGRTLIGVACGIAVPVGAVYSSETAEAGMRGLVGSMLSVLFAVGCLIGYFLDLVTSSWRMVTWISLSVPLLFLILLTFLPSSPRFFLMKGRNDEAIKELKLLREQDEEKLQKEFTLMEERIVSNKQTLNIFSNIWKNKTLVWRVMMLGFYFGACGGSVITAFIRLFLSKLGVSLSNDILAFGIGIVQLVGTLISMFTIDRFGRKPLLIFSGVCMSFGWGMLAAYSYFSPNTHNSSWIEYLVFVVIAFLLLSFSIGYRPVTFVIASEMLPIEVRGVGASLLHFSLSMAFGCLSQSVVYLLDAIGMAGISIILACINFTGILFCVFALQETKGKTLETINNLTGTVKENTVSNVEDSTKL